MIDEFIQNHKEKIKACFLVFVGAMISVFVISIWEFL